MGDVIASAPPYPYDATPGAVDLYVMPASAPCRAVWMACKAANIPVNIKYVDLMKGEQKNPDFVKVTYVPSYTIHTSVHMYAHSHTHTHVRAHIHTDLHTSVAYPGDSLVATHDL